MALLKVLVCVLLVTVAVAQEEDDGQYDPAKYETPFNLESDEGTVESRESEEPANPESPVESPVQPEESPVQPAESPVQPAEPPVPLVSPVQPAESPVPAVSPVKPVVERLSEVQPSYPAGVSPLSASTIPNVVPISPYPLLSPQQPLFPIIPQQVSPYVAQQIPPFQPQEVAPFIYSSPQVLRIAAEAFPTVAA